MKTSNRSFLARFILAMATWMLAAGWATAGVIITGTRAIYPVDARDITVRMTNTGNEPGLVQAWIDEGDSSVPLEKLDVPFDISPPMFRLDPTKTQLVRLIYNGPRTEPLEKEKLYWLNVLEIPPKPSAQVAKNYLQFAIKTRIKLFLRPGKQQTYNDPQPLMEQLKWRIDRSGGKTVKLTVENPSIFHVSLGGLVLRDSNKAALNKTPQSGMVLPRESLTIDFQLDNPAQVHDVGYTFIDDYGGYREGVGTLGR